MVNGQKTLLRKPQSLMEIGEFNIKWLFFHAFIHITKRISVANIYENLLQICSSKIMAFVIFKFSFGSDNFYNSGITEFLLINEQIQKYNLILSHYYGVYAIILEYNFFSVLFEYNMAM